MYCHLSNSISCGSSVKILIRLHLFDDDCFPRSKCFTIIYLSKYGKTVFSLKTNLSTPHSALYVRQSKQSAMPEATLRAFRLVSIVKSQWTLNTHVFDWSLAFLSTIVGGGDADDDNSAIIHPSASFYRLRRRHIIHVTHCTWPFGSLLNVGAIFLRKMIWKSHELAFPHG